MQETWKAEPTLGELFGDLARETRQLVRQEVQLAKVELKDNATRLGKGAGLVGTGAILGLGAYLSLLATVIALLATFLPIWVAAFIVAGVTGGAAYAIAMKGMKVLKETELAPRETIETVREDVKWLKNRA